MLTILLVLCVCKYLQRAYLAEVHTGKAPQQVLVNSKPIQAFANKDLFDAATTPGYYFGTNDRQGVVMVKTNFLSTAEKQVINVK